MPCCSKINLADKFSYLEVKGVQKTFIWLEFLYEFI